MSETLVRGGTVIEGTGATPRVADVRIAGDHITAVGRLSAQPGETVVDAHGNWVTPGFIDVHTHMDGWLVKTPLIESKLRQGFTTEVIMSDGISYAPVSRQNAGEWIYYLKGLNALQQEDYANWESIADYMSLVDGRNAQNALAQVPYANVRVLACGWGQLAPDDYQTLEIQDRIAQAMDEGACGLSTGLDYVAQCWADTDELVRAAEAIAGFGGIYATHVRYKHGTLAGMQEAVRIGVQSGAKVHISHLKGNSEQERDQLLEYIDNKAVHEVDFTFDVYPYLPGSTMLNYLMPYEAWRNGPLGVMSALTSRRLRDGVTQAAVSSRLELDNMVIAWVPGKGNTCWQGATLQAYVDASGKPAGDALCDFLIEENLAVLLVFHRGADELADAFLQHPCFLLGTDGILHPGGHVHPRQYGSAPRMLDTLISRGVLRLEQAVHSMTGRSADRFGLRNRGRIAEGCFADLLVIDPQRFKERNGFDNPAVLAEGLEHMWVNGQPVIASDCLMDSTAERFPGRALRFQPS